MPFACLVAGRQPATRHSSKKLSWTLVKTPIIAHSKYREGRLCGASSFDLLMIAYGEAIIGCTSHNAERALSALSVLEEKTRREPPSKLSSQLLLAYQTCKQLVHRKKFRMATSLLQALRANWREARQQANTA